MLYFAKTTGGFYNSELHDENIPVDAVEITAEEHTALLSGQAQGKPIKAGANGRPYNEEPAARTFSDAKTAKLTALAAKRYEVETGGVTVGGMTIMSDAVSQAKLTGAWLRVQRKPSASIRWKGRDGWVTVGKAEIEALVDAVSDHVQTCFDNEYAHSEAINALTTIAAVDAYDIETGW
jgi:hypothetical protein